MHDHRENNGPTDDSQDQDRHEQSEIDNADWAVLTEASSAFEAEIIAEAIRSRGVNAIAVSLPPPMLPVVAESQSGRAVVMVDKPDMHEAAIALEDVRNSHIGDQYNDSDHANPEASGTARHDRDHDHVNPESTQAEYDRIRRRRAGRMARYAVRVVIILAIIPIAAFNPLIAAGLLFAMLAVEVLLLKRAIRQASDADFDHAHDDTQRQL